jgi:hypothetical protein
MIRPAVGAMTKTAGKVPQLIRGIAAILFVWLTCAVTLSVVMARRAPAISFALGYRTSAGEAALALLQIADDPKANGDNIVALSRAALRREAVSVDAVVAMGTIAALRNQTTRAEQLFAYSEHLSRRNIPTQLWLIENAVERGRVDQALIHYDRAMSVSENTRPLLLPILSQAAASPAVGDPLARMLARRPLWWPAAMDYFLASPNAQAILPKVVLALKLRADVPTERTYLISAMKRLSDAGKTKAALSLYGTVRGPTEATAPIRGGDFEHVGNLPPFDWNLTESAGVSGIIQPGGVGSGHALFLSAEAGEQGEAARQVLDLPPGAYRLTAIAGSVAPDRIDRPRLVLSCLIPDKTVLIDLPFPTATERGTSMTGSVIVPPGCKGQLIQVIMHASLDGSGGGTMPWIDDIRITQMSIR